MKYMKLKKLKLPGTLIPEKQNIELFTNNLFI